MEKRNSKVITGEDFVRIYKDNIEVVGWHESEWIEDPEVMIQIIGYINDFYKYGVDYIQKKLQGNGVRP